MPLKRVSNFLFRAKNKGLFQHKIEKLIGFKVIDIEHYKKTFTHPVNKKNKNNSLLNYERLEFLGDSVLGMIISEYLFDKKQSEPEGYLTQMRSKFVNRNNLNAIGDKLQLIKFLTNSKDTNLGKNVNGNLLEALIGAIYKDRGLVYAKKFVFNHILSHHDFDKLEQKISSYKSFLYEWAQKNKNKIELNTFEEENADDITIFVCVLRINDKVIAKGRDTNKKNAEENASKRAFYSIKTKLNGN